MKIAKIEFELICPFNRCFLGNESEQPISYGCNTCKHSLVRKDKVIEIKDCNKDSEEYMDYEEIYTPVCGEDEE